MLDAIRSALRQIRSHPGFAAAVVLTIAVGVGATTAVFTLADRMLFRPLPFPESERLIRLRQQLEGRQALLRVGDYLRLERDHEALESLTQFELATAGRIEGLGDETILVDGVSEGFFAVFGFQPVRGRTFTAEEYGTRTALPDVAMITYGLWQSAFAGRDDVIGQTLRVEGPRPQSFSIVGVLPPAFMTPSTVNQQAQIILPMSVDPAQAADPRFGADPVIRLRPGVSLEAAAAEAQAIVIAVERDFPQFDQGRRVVVIPLQESLFGPVRTPLLMLLGVTLCALLLACANLAQLFLARLHARRREIGVRLAIGAGPWRLVRQFVTEAGVLAVLGGMAALLFARATVAFIMARTPDFSHVYRLLPAEIDLRVAAFAALLVAVALTIYGVLPALLASRPDVRSALQTGGTSTPAWGRRDAGLIFLQSALALALLVTGTLIVRSYVGLSTQEIGFEPDGVQSIVLELPTAPGTSREATARVRRDVYEHLRERLPAPVALTGGIPGVHLVVRADRPDYPTDDRRPGRLMVFPASASFFDVFRLRLTRGRLFTEEEAFVNPPVVVIDERAAASLWPGEDPIGKSLLEWRGDRVLRTVIGVVATVRTRLVDDDATGTGYQPFSPSTMGSSSLVMRAGSRGVSLDTIRSAVHEIAPGVRVTVSPVRPFERALGQPRFLATLLGSLVIVAMLLTVIGVFGVVNHEVVRRTREVGIRMALGASGARIRRFMLSRAIVPAAAGVAAGIIASLWWTPALQALLFGLESHDPASFALAAGLVLLTVATASFVPAWRASRVDPIDALRVE